MPLSPRYEQKRPQRTDREVYAIRRRLDTASAQALSPVLESITHEVLGHARVFEAETVGVTVIGHSRFYQHDIKRPSVTAQVIEAIDSCHKPLPVTLGDIALFASREHPKLGFQLRSSELNEEIRQCELKFDELGVPLKPSHYAQKSRPHNGGQEHLSIAILWRDFFHQYGNKSVQKRLSSCATTQGLTHLTLLPPNN